MVGDAERSTTLSVAIGAVSRRRTGNSENNYSGGWDASSFSDNGAAPTAATTDHATTATASATTTASESASIADDAVDVELSMVAKTPSTTTAATYAAAAATTGDTRCQGDTGMAQRRQRFAVTHLLVWCT